MFSACPRWLRAFFNLGSIIGGVGFGYLLDPHFGSRALIGLALGTLVGGLAQLLVQVPSLARVGFKFRPDFHWRDPGVRNILILMGPATIAASAVQINVAVNSGFASSLGDGPMTWLNIAFRLMQLPLGLFGVAIATVTLPLVSRSAALGNTMEFRGALAHSLRLVLLLTDSIRDWIDHSRRADHQPHLSTRPFHCRSNARNCRRVALLCHRPRWILGRESPRARVLRDQQAQPADVGQLIFHCSELWPQLVLPFSVGVGSSRTRALHQCCRDYKFCSPLCNDAKAHEAFGDDDARCDVGQINHRGGRARIHLSRGAVCFFPIDPKPAYLAKGDRGDSYRRGRERCVFWHSLSPARRRSARCRDTR